MARHHEIDLEMFQEYIQGHEVSYAYYSGRENKRLWCGLNGDFRVTVAGAEKYKGRDAVKAAEIYNSITEKYIKPEFKL